MSVEDQAVSHPHKTLCHIIQLYYITK